MVQHRMLFGSGVRSMGQREFRCDYRAGDQQLEYRDCEADPSSIYGIARRRGPRGLPERLQPYAIPGIGQESAQRELRADQRRASAAADSVRAAVLVLIAQRGMAGGHLHTL